MLTARLILLIGLISLYCSNAIGIESQEQKLFIEGVFEVQSNLYVPAVRDYHRIVLKMETDRGKLFYLNLRKDLKEQKQFSVGDTYLMRIEVTDIYLIENEKQFKVYDHPKDRRGYVIDGLVKFMKRVTADNPIKRYSQ
jgi:hypothetical protein